MHKSAKALGYGAKDLNKIGKALAFIETSRKNEAKWDSIIKTAVPYCNNQMTNVAAKLKVIKDVTKCDPWFSFMVHCVKFQMLLHCPDFNAGNLPNCLEWTKFYEACPDPWL